MENIIPVITKTRTAIENELKTFISSKTPVTTRNEAATSNIVAEAVAREIGYLYEELSRLTGMAFLSTSSGIGIDRLSDFFSLTRGASKRAVALNLDTFKFYVDIDAKESVTSILTKIQNTTKDSNPNTFPDYYSFVIRSGTVITTTDGRTYVTQDDILISDENREGFSGIISSGSGERYNVGQGDLNIHQVAETQPELIQIIDYIKCTNIQGINSASNTETDDNFRWRISNRSVSAANANDTTIRDAILGIPGISDFSITKRIYGNGTTGIKIQTISPVTDNGTLNAVESACEIVGAMGEKFYVTAPEYLAITMAFCLYYQAGANRQQIEAMSTSAVVEYINTLPLGGEIIINEIIQRVMELDNKIRDISINGLGYGIYNRENMMIEDFTQIRIANQKCKFDQKFLTKSSWIAVCDETTR